MGQTIPVDSIGQDTISTISNFTDSISIPIDTSFESTRPQPSSDINVVNANFSKDSLDGPVDYESADSMRYDITGEKIHLFGNAKVSYQTTSLNADYIILDWVNNIVIAEGTKDPFGKIKGRPEFKDGEQSFTANKMKYNFITQKGVIYDVTSKEGDLYVLGSKAKFVSGSGDSTHVHDHVCSEDAAFTTCNHPEPHFAIRSRKQKVIPNKVVVVGPSNLEIAGIPTPIWLPFGFFPITKGQRSGLIFPRDYEYSENWGFGIRNIGYYTPIGEYFDLQVTFDIYLRGTWGVQARSNYRRRYRYNGNLSLAYSDRRSEFPNSVKIRSNKSYSLRWSHNQDSKAHPTNRFSGNVNIQTNDFQSLNQNDAQSVLQNQLSSNISFSKTFPGRPYNLNMSMSHSQNTATNKVQINLPVVNFQMNRIFPFKSKKATKNKESWYEKISMQYTGKAQNRLLATDSTLLSSKTLRDAQYAARHDISTNASFRVLKYFNLTPNASYNETWYFQTIEKNFDPSTVYQVDTIFNPNDPTDFSLDSTIVSFGQVDTDTLSGFRALRQFNMGISMNTQIFGTMLFKKGWLRGIRHVIKPSISFNYTPNYTDPKWGYFDYVQTDSREEDELTRYTIFEGGIYGTPSSGGRQMALNYSFNNIFEGKYFSKKDTTEKKFKVFDNIVVSGNHNFAADSLNWSQVRVNGTTRFFKGLSTLSMSAIWDPYTVDDDGRRINVFHQAETGKLLRFVNANARLNTSISISKIKNLFKKPGSGSRPNSGGSNPRPSNPGEPTTTNRGQRGQTNDDLLGFFDGFSLNHSFVIEKTMFSGIDTLLIRTNTVSMRGSIPLTKGWAVRVGNIGYDFNTKRITYPDLGFTRDLHCWQMGMNWQPQRGTYQFYLRVKPGSLDFLEIPVRKNNADAFGGF